MRTKGNEVGFEVSHAGWWFGDQSLGACFSEAELCQRFFFCVTATTFLNFERPT